MGLKKKQQKNKTKQKKQQQQQQQQKKNHYPVNNCYGYYCLEVIFENFNSLISTQLHGHEY